jgi:hypothetical protein
MAFTLNMCVIELGTTVTTLVQPTEHHHRLILSEPKNALYNPPDMQLYADMMQLAIMHFIPSTPLTTYAHAHTSPNS